jgi:hypothetical protein
MAPILLRLARHEADHEFARQIIQPEEERRALSSISWQGSSLFDRLLEVDDFAMIRRHLRDTITQLGALVDVKNRLFGRIGIHRLASRPR